MKYLIVAQYNEDPEWTKDVPSDWKVMIITKDKDLPNVGREASTYFHAFQKLYNKLKDDDTVVCVQGHPFDHYGGLIERLSQPVEEWEWLGDHTFIARHDGYPNHPGLPVGDKLKEWLDIDWTEDIRFHSGGQFMVSGKKIKQHPKKFYRYMQDEMTPIYGAFIMERLWYHLFNMV